MLQLRDSALHRSIPLRVVLYFAGAFFGILIYQVSVAGYLAGIGHELICRRWTAQSTTSSLV